MRRLNLGCGNDVKPGWFNYDMFPCDSRVMYLDLNKLPLNFETESIDEINLSQVLEHLTVHPQEFITECYRILKPNGVLTVGLPCMSSQASHMRWYHPISYMNPMVMVKGKRLMGYDALAYYGRCDFELLSVTSPWRISWFLRRLYEFVRAMGGCDIIFRMRKP